MKTHYFRIAAACLLVAGCARPPVDVTVEADVAAVAGVAREDVRLRIDPLPDDAIASPAGALTFVDAVRLAVSNGPELPAALARVRVAQAEAGQARLLPNPVLDLAIRFPEQGKTVIDAGLTADLISILRRPGAVAAADARLRGEAAAAVTTALELVQRVQQVYRGAQARQSALDLLQQQRGLLDRLVKIADSRLQAGEGDRLALLTVEAQQAESDSAIAQTRAELTQYRLQLARLIGQPSLPAEWALDRWSPPAALAASEPELIAAALNHRPEIQQRRWELEALGFDRNQASLFIFDGAAAGVSAEREESWSVGPAVAIPLPLMDFGQAQREKFAAMVVESRHNLAAARRQVIEDVRRAHAGVIDTRKSLELIEQRLLPLQESRRGMAESQYKAGAADITLLLLAEQDWYESQERLLAAQQQLSEAQLNLERSLGGAAALLAVPNTPTTTQPSKAP